jgi:hypothetical protein
MKVPKGRAALLAMLVLLLVVPARADDSSGIDAAGRRTARPTWPKQRRNPQLETEPTDVHVERDERREHAFYFELFGAGGAYSVNLEYRPVTALAIRGGGSVFAISDEEVIVFPASVTGLIGDGGHHFEMGGGATLVIADELIGILLVPEIGYRYMPKVSRWLVRVMFTPFISLEESNSWARPSGGLSLGATF